MYIYICLSICLSVCVCVCACACMWRSTYFYAYCLCTNFYLRVVNSVNLYILEFKNCVVNFDKNTNKKLN